MASPIICGLCLVLVGVPQVAEAKPRVDGARFRAWDVDIEETSPTSNPTIEVQVIDGTGFVPKTRAGQAKRYIIEARLGGRWRRQVTDQATFRVNGQPGPVSIRIRDRYGPHYHDVLQLRPDTRHVLTLTSQWIPPIYRGRYINRTKRCKRGVRRTLRFTVRVPGDMAVGRPVKVRPGRAGLGPPLPDGQYRIEVEAWSRGRWRDDGDRRLTVNGGRWRLIETCER